jgi:hypothetical protein
MKRFQAVAAVLWLVGLAGAAWGADMKLSVSGGVEYDDNVRRTDPATQDDVIFRVTPKVEFMEDEGDLNWNVHFQMPYEKSLVTNAVDNLNYLASIRSRYRLNDRTRLSFTDSFRYAEAVSTTTAIDSSTSVPTIGSFREPVFRNSLNLGVQYAFTPRLNGNLSFVNRVFASDLPNRANNLVWGGNANVRYALSPRHQFGGGLAGTFQDIAESNNGRRAPIQTLFVNMFASWVWQIDETTSFEITAGPTFVDTQQDAPPPSTTAAVYPTFQTGGKVFGFNANTCPDVGADKILSNACEPTPLPFPDGPGLSANDIADIEAAGDDQFFFLGPVPTGGSASNWTIFGEASLNKRWSPTLVSSLVYSRQDSTASGLAGSSTLDLFTFLTTWQMAELWRSGLRADFTRRESVSPVQESFLVVENAPLPTDGTPIAQSTGLTSSVIDQAIDTIRWGVSARVERKLTKHIFVALRYSFNRQESAKGSFGNFSDFNDNIVALSVQYDFDRWRLW